jgi:hypothetical protein
VRSKLKHNAHESIVLRLNRRINGLNLKFTIELAPTKFLIQNERMNWLMSTTTTTTVISKIEFVQPKININLHVSGGKKDGYLRVTCESGMV